MAPILIQLKKRLLQQIHLIQSSSINILDKVTLTRSLLENYSTFNFLNGDHSAKRIELFQCFGDFEWYSHRIYEIQPINQRIESFKNFLVRIKHKYPYGYQKYGRLIKRRLCKKLRELIHSSPNPKLWQKQLDIVNSNKPTLLTQQLTLMANYMSKHLITKLPFPYRIVFGKSITYFVLKYSLVDRSTYWLLADLSHGTLIKNHFDQNFLNQRIKKILQIINSRITH